MGEELDASITAAAPETMLQELLDTITDKESNCQKSIIGQDKGVGSQPKEEKGRQCRGRERGGSCRER